MPASSSREPTLADLLEALERLGGAEFHEVDLRVGRSRLRVVREPPPATLADSLLKPASVVAPPPGDSVRRPPPAEETPGAEESAGGDSGLDAVTAPMLGTFYRRPRPEAAPFVTVGDQVKKGQVLCIIEAMKLMNNIEAETSGEIVEILPEDGDPVQFGDRLLLIRPA